MGQLEFDPCECLYVCFVGLGFGHLFTWQMSFFLRLNTWQPTLILDEASGCSGATRCWQLKYFLMFTLKMGKIPMSTHMFQMGWVETTNQL